MSSERVVMLDVEQRRTAVAGEGAWRREARAVIAAAARRGIALSEAALAYCDVNDLQTLCHCLESGHDDRALRRLAVRLRLEQSLPPPRP